LAENYHELINTLEFEDEVNFTAKFTELGNESMPNYFELISIVKLNKKTPFAEIKAIDIKQADTGNNLRKPNT